MVYSSQSNHDAVVKIGIKQKLTNTLRPIGLQNHETETLVRLLNKI